MNVIKLTIKACAAWCGNLQTEADWRLWANEQLPLKDNDDLPLLTRIPAMQRRRLSRFAKLSFHCALSVIENEPEKLPCIFASRHGDIHKTSKLLQNVAIKEDLSPTQFGLSVHNAVAGLYSMFDNNTQAMTAISSGEDTFLMALVDAYAKMESQNLTQLLLVYTDEALPEIYKEFSSAHEKTIALAMVLERSTDNNGLKINFARSKHEPVQPLFQPLAFLHFLYGDEPECLIESTRYEWQLEK